MQDSVGIREQCSCILLNLYSCMNPNFQKEQCNYKMLDTFYNVIGDSELEGLYTEMTPYIRKHSDMLKQVIQCNKDRFIYDQPAYLFVYFSLRHWNNKIINGWPYDYETLVSIVRTSGYSSNILFGA